ncbi:ORF6N domain-containing protein [Flavobacteriaceae bacterium]|jgi:hypothetical protein|nr:ORF6N domain-containing protein [Flavobacteriaceae bacterium]MDC0385939.1 ORF6N domain-containing protein [Flavobacteriaceae bacterium]
MRSPITIENIQDLLIPIERQQVLIDRDVAKLYGVATKRINEAVKNNPDKFPESYLITLNKKQWDDLRSKISTTNFSKTRVPPKAFTERGLYMLATILKSKQATQTTFLIIETFAKLRALQHSVAELSSSELVEGRKKNQLLKKSGELMAELLDQNLSKTESETTIELNFAMLKLRHTTKRKKE